MVLGSAPAGAAPLEVVIEGVSGELLENVRAHLDIDDLAESEDPDSDRVRRSHRRAAEEIRAALQPFGYYSPRIRSRLIIKTEGWRARYIVDPGPATRIDPLELEITGAGTDDPALRRVLAGSELTKGARLRHSAYAATKRSLIETAVERGYLEARFSRQEIRVHPETARAGVYLVLDTGPAYYFGSVRIRQDILDPAFVDRLVPLAPGDRITSRRLLDLQFALSDTDYFRQVNVEVQRDRAEPFASPAGEDTPAKRAPLLVSTEPRPPRKYTLGLGYGTDTGPRVSAGLVFRRVTRTGHRVQGDVLLSEVRQAATAAYQIPIANVRTDRLSFTGQAQQSDYGDTASRRYSLGVSQDMGWRGWRRSLYVRYAQEREFGAGRREYFRLLTPGASLSRTRADDTAHPRQGWSLFSDIHGARKGVLSGVSFTQTRLTARSVLPLGSRVRFLARLEGGASFVGDPGNLPPSERFFAGGDRSVRGYAYQSLAPRDADGDVIGGQYLLTGSLEADLRVWGDYGVAVFYDAGNAANEFPPKPEEGAGGGLRWFSPVGTIRLDLGWAISRPHRDWRFHFSMGPDL